MKRWNAVSTEHMGCKNTALINWFSDVLSSICSRTDTLWHQCLAKCKFLLNERRWLPTNGCHPVDWKTKAAAEEEKVQTKMDLLTRAITYFLYY